LYSFMQSPNAAVPRMISIWRARALEPVELDVDVERFAVARDAHRHDAVDLHARVVEARLVGCRRRGEQHRGGEGERERA
jgi:hypothetical protein